MKVSSFAYQLQNAAIAALAASKYDLLVIDNNQKPENIQKLKPKIVIGYISLGEAEDYRPYWKSSWHSKPPTWLGKENKSWRGNYTVKQFWHPEWWEITKTILDDVINKGFDGVAIDKVDVFDDLGSSSVLKERMSNYIARVSAYCKKRKPGFLIIAHNADSLVKYPLYLSAIDGITQEDLVFDWNSNGNTGKETNEHYRGEVVANLKKIKDAGKLVMILEYVSGKSYQKVQSYCNTKGFICYSAPRDLGSLR